MGFTHNCNLLFIEGGTVDAVLGGVDKIALVKFTLGHRLEFTLRLTLEFTLEHTLEFTLGPTVAALWPGAV